MSSPALRSSEDARFQAALATALALPGGEPAKRATSDVIDLEGCKQEMMTALEWASRNRDKWMRLRDPAPVQEERACEGDGLANDARMASAAQSETVAGLAAEGANDRLDAGNVMPLTSPSAHVASGPELVDAGHQGPARSPRAAASHLAVIDFFALRGPRRRGPSKTPTARHFSSGGPHGGRGLSQ